MLAKVHVMTGVLFRLLGHLALRVIFLLIVGLFGAVGGWLSGSGMAAMFNLDPQVAIVVGTVMGFLLAIYYADK